MLIQYFCVKFGQISEYFTFLKKENLHLLGDRGSSSLDVWQRGNEAINNEWIRIEEVVHFTRDKEGRRWLYYNKNNETNNCRVRDTARSAVSAKNHSLSTRVLHRETWRGQFWPQKSFSPDHGRPSSRSPIERSINARPETPPACDRPAANYSDRSVKEAATSSEID
jgi:hypothetical protein